MAVNGPAVEVEGAVVSSDVIAAEQAGHLRVVKVNVDQAPDVSAQLGVQGIPTMLLFNNGAEVARQVGALPADAIRRWPDDALTG